MKVYEPFPDGDIKDDSSYYSGSSLTGASSSNGIGRQYQYHQQNQQISSSSLGRDVGSLSSQLGGGIAGSAIAGGVPTNTVPQKTYTSVTEIDFRLDREHLQQDGQFLNIRCVATVVDQMWDSQTSISRQRSQPSTYSSTGHNPSKFKCIYQ